MASVTGSLPNGHPIIEWGWAGSALEPLSGDLHVVVPYVDGALVALIDGLGHGEEAADAAGAAVPVLQAQADGPVLTLMERCHEALRKTRGAAVSLASFNALDASMTWTGVGNVEGALLRISAPSHRASEGITLRGGVVGYRLPPLHANTVPVAPGDVLILATDGIRSGFTEGVAIGHGVQDIADAILARFAKGSDDAHVVVVRYLGGEP